MTPVIKPEIYMFDFFFLFYLKDIWMGYLYNEWFVFFDISKGKANSSCFWSFITSVIHKDKNFS